MNEIERIQQRTRSYWYCDGIAELIGGIAMMLVGFPMVAAARTGAEMISTIALMAMILLFPATARIVGLLKDRITHKRTGYVQYPRPAMTKRRKLAIFSVLVGVAAAMLVALWGGDYTLNGTVGKALLLGVGAGMAVAFVLRAKRLQIPRLYIVAVVAGAATLLSGLSDFGFVEGVGWLLATIGSASVITGGVALITYLSRHPRVPQETP